MRTSRGKSFLRTEFVPNELCTRSHLSRGGQRTRTYVTIAARFSQQCVRSCCNSQPTLHYPATACFGQRFVLSCYNVFWPTFCTVSLQRVLANVCTVLLHIRVLSNVCTVLLQRVLANILLSCYIYNVFWPTFVLSCYNVFWPMFVLSCYNVFWPAFVLSYYSIFKSVYGRAAPYFSIPRAVLLQRVWFKQFY